jgi:hypothetical protein
MKFAPLLLGLVAYQSRQRYGGIFEDAGALTGVLIRGDA